MSLSKAVPNKTIEDSPKATLVQDKLLLLRRMYRRVIRGQFHTTSSSCFDTLIASSLSLHSFLQNDLKLHLRDASDALDHFPNDSVKLFSRLLVSAVAHRSR